jgi:hypothetical protein
LSFKSIGISLKKVNIEKEPQNDSFLMVHF